MCTAAQNTSASRILPSGRGLTTPSLKAYWSNWSNTSSMLDNIWSWRNMTNQRSFRCCLKMWNKDIKCVPLWSSPICALVIYSTETQLILQVACSSRFRYEVKLLECVATVQQVSDLWQQLYWPHKMILWSVFKTSRHVIPQACCLTYLSVVCINTRILFT
jgi:hypothetical protein